MKKTIIFFLAIIFTSTPALADKYKDFLISLPDGNKQQWLEIDQSKALNMFILNYEYERKERVKKENLYYSVYDALSGQTFDTIDAYIEWRDCALKQYIKSQMEK